MILLRVNAMKTQPNHSTLLFVVINSDQSPNQASVPTLFLENRNSIKTKSPLY